jgi:hypothetical protein
MSKLDSLRRLIREEVRAVFQEELAGILKEAIMVPKGNSSIVESVKPPKQTVPGTLNRPKANPFIAPNLGAGNPLNNLLAETAISMTSNDIGAFGGQEFSRETQVVESVDGMFATARKSSNFDAIEITDVPDFTGLMNKMKANGEI